MTYVHLTNVPGHVRWLPGNLNALIEAVPIDFINVIYPDRHPNAFICGFASFFAKGRGLIPSPTTSLAIEAEEDLALTRAYATERRRISPVPAFLPPQLLEPIKALLDIGNVQNRSQSPRKHHVAFSEVDFFSRFEFARELPEPPNG